MYDDKKSISFDGLLDNSFIWFTSKPDAHTFCPTALNDLAMETNKQTNKQI